MLAFSLYDNCKNGVIEEVRKMWSVELEKTQDYQLLTFSKCSCFKINRIFFFTHLTLAQSVQVLEITKVYKMLLRVITQPYGCIETTHTECTRLIIFWRHSIIFTHHREDFCYSKRLEKYSTGSQSMKVVRSIIIHHWLFWR